MLSKLFLKPFKDVKDMKGRLIAIGLVFMVTLGLTIGGLYAKGMMVETREKLFDDADMADMELSVNDANGTIIEQLRGLDGISQVEGRLILNGLIEDPSETKPIILVGVDEPELNTFSLEKGSGELEGNQVLITGKDPAFSIGESFDCSINGIDKTLEVVGTVKSAEYAATPPVPGSTIPMPGDTPVVYISIQELQSLTSLHYNDILVKLEDGVEESKVREQIRSIVDQAGLNSISGQEEEYVYQIFEAAIEEEEKVIPIMSVIFSVIGAVLIIVVISKIILSQQKEMGVLMAMGYSQKRIIFSYVNFGVILGLITGILGGILGIFIGYMWAGYGLQIFLDIQVVTKFTLYPFLLSIGLGVSLVTIAILLSVYRINHMSAREAMRSSESEDTIVKFSFGKALKNISKFSLRNIIRKPKRVVALLVVLSLTIGISGSWLIMMDSMVGQAENWNDHQEWDLQVTFTVPVRQNQLEQMIQNYEREVQRYETYSIGHAELEGENLKMLGVPENSEMVNFIQYSGSLDYGNGKCLITSKIANDFEKGPGDELVISSDSKEVELEISGVVTDLRENTIFLSQEEVQNITSMGGYSNGIFLNTDEDIQEVKRTLYGFPGVSYVISSDDFSDSLDTMVQEMRGMLYFLFWVNLSLLIVTIITVSLINVLERKSEYALLEMLGYRKRDSAKIIFQEIISIGIVSTVIGVPTCYGFSLILRDIYSDLMFYYPVLISSVTLTVIVSSSIVFFILSMLSPIRVIQKTDIADALRERTIE